MQPQHLPLLRLAINWTGSVAFAWILFGGQRQQPIIKYECVKKEAECVKKEATDE
jgi:hypothetical protein